MRYLDRDDIPEEEIEKVYAALTNAFEASGAEVGSAMAAMCHKLASIAAEVTDSEEEAGVLLAAFANDVLKRVDFYRIDRVAGTA